MTPREVPPARAVEGLVDTHCHLAHVADEPAAVLEAARAAGVETVVDIGMGAEESAAAAEGAGTLGTFASAGLHPNDLAAYVDDPAGAVAAIEAVLGRPRVVAVGETGLDLYRDRSDPDVQERAFRDHIALAHRHDAALVIHCRDAHERLLAVLDDAGAPPRVVMHCFSGDEAFAKACADRGYYCSFAGNITYRRSDDLRAAARVLPAELLLIETDAPYLAPEPLRGKPNAPALLPYTAAALADVRSVGLDALAQTLRDNATRAFRLG